MERLTERTAQGTYRLVQGCTAEEAAARLAGYENAHAFLREEFARAEAKLAALRGQGRARSAAFQQALAEKLCLLTLLERLERPPKG